MWSSWTENAKKAIEKTTASLTETAGEVERRAANALETAGEAITKAATQTPTSPSAGGAAAATAAATAADKSDQGLENEIEKVEREVAEAGTADATTTSKTTPTLPNIDREKMLNLWSSVQSSAAQQLNAAAHASKEAIEKTKHVVEDSRTNLERQFQLAQNHLNPVGGHRKGVFYKRDPQLPLDVDALRDANVVYITDRIITMGHPATDSTTDPNITAERKLAAVGHLLNRRHDGRFLVLNLSEVEYDNSILDEQVLTFSFPGSPSPPLGLLLKLLVAMENWMKADERNVAVVHCLTGKGRTSMVTASFLCWMGEAGFGDINEALAYIAKCKELNPDELTIPSQRRYASYFKNMLDGVRPSQPPLMLKRIIMSEAPRFAKGPPRDDVSKEQTEEQRMGCAPYLQIFKAGKLIHTSAATLHVQQSEEELPFVQVIDGTVSFNVNQIIQGDVLLRCRHLTFSKKRVSMFRAAFHTGYVPPNVLRLTKSQLDGACSDKRFQDEFYLDLVFEKLDAEALSKHIEASGGDGGEEGGSGDNDKDEGNEKQSKGTGPIVTASTVDTMLQGDSRFWDVIADKRKEVVKQGSPDLFWGPTVGRRRGDSKKTEGASDSSDNPSEGSAKEEQAPLPTFSIGNEFDFLPVSDPKATKKVETPQQRDSLMDALNALDEDEAHETIATEEIVFDAPTSAAFKPSATGPASGELFSNEDVQNTASSGVEKTQAPAVSTGETAVTNDATPSSAPPSSTPTEQEQQDEDAVEDMDALLATTDDLLADLDLGDLDDDDDGDLDDLEAMLNS
mmetsp:Transcript_331/g.819  ORF Transcript_331/g.819 Transcript_331/m.819 type:complete len:794 (+) Transcript_331:54-2435(+)